MNNRPRRQSLVEAHASKASDEELSRRISTKSKAARAASNIIAPTGFSLGLTSGLLLKLSTPIASGGLGIAAVGSSIFVGLTCGAGAIALLVGGFCYYHFYKKSIKDSIDQLGRLESHKITIEHEEEFLRENQLEAFNILLKLKKAMNEEKGQKREEIANLIQAHIDSSKIKVEKLGIVDELEEENWDIASRLDCFEYPTFPPTKKSQASIWWSLYAGISAGASSISMSYVLYASLLGALTFNPFTAPIAIIALTVLVVSLTVGFAFHYLAKEKARTDTQINTTKQEIITLHDVGLQLSQKNLNSLQFLATHYSNLDTEMALEYQTRHQEQTKRHESELARYVELDVELSQLQQKNSELEKRVQLAETKAAELEARVRSVEAHEREALDKANLAEIQTKKANEHATSVQKELKEALERAAQAEARVRELEAAKAGQYQEQIDQTKVESTRTTGIFLVSPEPITLKKDSITCFSIFPRSTNIEDSSLIFVDKEATP